MKQAIYGILILAIALLMAADVSAQGDGPSDDEVNAIAKGLYCPVCESVPLDVCPSLACQQWRQQIKDKLILGWDQEQIYDYFVDQYGDRVLASPPARGLNWLIYILPPLAIIGGGVLFYRTYTEGKKKGEESKAKTKIKSDDLQRLEDELDARR